MPLENLIIHLYCLACDAMASRPENQPLRSRGFAPALSDEEALCIEMAGEILGMDQDKQIHAYFKRHWLHFFPRLGCRTTFARQAANLWAAKREVHAALLAAFDGREASLFVADGFPLPACGFSRAHFSKLFKGEAAFGHCAAKKQTFYGFRGMLLINSAGMVVDFALAPANADEREILQDLRLKGLRGHVLADKGFNGPKAREALAGLGLGLQTPSKKNMAEERPKEYLRAMMSARRLVETVIGQLAERMSIEKCRARDGWHLMGRLWRKILAHAACVAINMKLGNPPLQIERLFEPL